MRPLNGFYIEVTPIKTSQEAARTKTHSELLGDRSSGLSFNVGERSWGMIMTESVK